MTKFKIELKNIEIKIQEPHWERGYRCHGYWNRKERVGHVGLSPRIPDEKTVYSWAVEEGGVPISEGTELTLRAAKRAVERRYEFER